MTQNEALKTIRQALEILIGALVMLHLMPLMGVARAGMQSPSDMVRVIDRETLNLSDVFPAIDPEMDRALGLAPQPGQDIVLNARTLMRLASAYGVDWEPVSVADQVVLRREGVTLNLDDFKNALQADLAEKGVTDPIEIIFTSRIPSAVLPPNAPTHLNVTRLDYLPQFGSFSAQITPDAMPGRPISVAGKIEKLIEVPVLRNFSERGTLLTDSALQTMTLRASLLPRDALTDAADLVGQTTRRSLLPGKVIRAGDVERPLSVTRGQKIALLYRVGGMELGAQGRALQEGRTGDRIRVVNTDSNKNLQGTVTADGQVTID